MRDEVWAVIAEAVSRYTGVCVTDEDRAVIERCQLIEFDGGCFVIRGNEVDLFVTPDRRGRWATRELLDRVFGGMVKEHGRVICGVHKNNEKSLRFVHKLGFTEYAREGDLIRLELSQWKSLRH